MSELLQTYLQDHEAGARGGVDLIKRAAKSHSDPEVRRLLGELLREVRGERQRIQHFLDVVGGDTSTLKQIGVQAGEKVARLKPNRRFKRRSPLSDLVELEGILLAVRGKELGFDALLALDDPRLDRDEIDQLREQARDQQNRVQELHDRTAAVVLKQD